MLATGCTYITWWATSDGISLFGLDGEIVRFDPAQSWAYPKGSPSHSNREWDVMHDPVSGCFTGPIATQRKKSESNGLKEGYKIASSMQPKLRENFEEKIREIEEEKESALMWVSSLSQQQKWDFWETCEESISGVDLLRGGLVNRCSGGVKYVVLEEFRSRGFDKVSLISFFGILESLGGGFERW